MLSVAGCSESVPDGPTALNNSLAKIENARTVSELSRQAAQAPLGIPLVLPQTKLTSKEVGDEPQPGTFIVKVESSAGDFTIEVHRVWAPIGAERFYQLIKAGYYNECRYFRVVPGFMVQFGMHGDPAVQNEWDKKILDDAVTQMLRVIVDISGCGELENLSCFHGVPLLGINNFEFALGDV